MAERTEPTPEELGFAGCLGELEAIVRALESDTIDVDELTGKVERASELVQWCRGRLDGTRLRVDEILGRLDDATAEGDADGAAGEE